ncbi:hypothetical protein H2203_007078 [Taxawa tesnikishii (nom. ined.)]|nr:hypothetical protein H2203_007078 [Dothideales sp. JES 119]
MKSSLPTNPPSRAPPQQNKHSPQPSPTTTAPNRPVDNVRTLSTRPSLVRSPPEPSQRAPRSVAREHTDNSASNDSNGESEEGGNGSTADNGSGSGSEQADKSTKGQKTAHSTEAEIARLKAAVNARLLQKQYRPPIASHASSPGPLSNAAGRRPSPIKEESPNAPPAVSSTVGSPLATTQTSSTESTNSSSRTIRGSMPATPAAGVPLRTPSYPFPYIPGTPRAWSSSFHQPFTALSPTVSATRSGETVTPGGSAMSGASTPAATAAGFIPPGGAYPPGPEDPRYPTPNLYEMVLRLGAEPGLEAWWYTVAKIMRDAYKADRVALALPADTNDIENVPWGQKATFNIAGTLEPSDESSSSSDQSANPPRFEFPAEARTPGVPPTSSRPALQLRHSYAGHSLREGLSELPNRAEGSLRPSMPSRTASHAPSLLGGRRDLPHSPLPENVPHVNVRHSSMSDPEFSSVGGEIPATPLIAVFPVLKALDHEVDGLIDTAGVNRVLERGKLVTLTRDYTSDASDTGRTSQTSGETPTPTAQPPTPADTTSQRPPARVPGMLGSYRSIFSAMEASGQRRGSGYEEYEQYPPSPWAQSPAPSPAIQADEETNPFFASEGSVEESFNPSAPTQDYTQFEAVEAIGVDRASTVIHLPLIHPILSMPMEPVPTSPDQPPSGKTNSERRAPIAILSVLSPAVPYPQNLTHSLQLLGPHLATSYYMAQQYTSTHTQAMGIRHRRTASGHNVGFAPLSLEPANLDDLIRADLDLAGSISGSMTSPSDYSGRSRHSPTGSLVGTPGWDPAAYGLTTSKSVAGTPVVSGTEMIDSYFDAKKRTSLHRSTSTTAGPASQHATPARSGRRSPSHDARSTGKLPVPSPGGEDAPTPRSERKPRMHIFKDKSPLRPSVGRETSPTRHADVSSPRRPTFRSTPSQAPDASDRRHSLLHSYGADFSSSFQGLPAATTPLPRTPALVHARQPSVSETADMPPPSERLLRTIIDSLPVQIFTASPGTGALTWVNSKFLVYRGQDSRQVLREPWQAIHPEDRSTYMDTWNRSLRTGQQLQQKVRLQRFDGNYRWFYVRAAPLKDKRQNIVHWIGTNMDVHEQHLAELNSAKQQETAASEAKYRALANSSPQVVFTVNKTKGVTFCNSQWLNYSGQTEAQALGLGFMEHVHPDDIVKCRLPTFEEGMSQPTNVPTSLPTEPRRTKSSSAASSSGSSDTERGPTSPLYNSPTTQLPQAKLSQLASTGILKVSRDADGRPSYSTEVRLRSKDGEYRWHLVRVLLAEQALQQEGEEETWYGTCTDINDHKALERDLKETMDEKSRFLSNMSHEIRTPLNGITGMVNFLIDSSLSAEQMEHVNIIRASTEGLRGLINDILDLSKAEAGMIQLNMDWLHVRSLIEEVNDLTSAMAIDKGLELNYLVEHNVPPQIKGDRFRIRQILLNVIGNAIKFTPTGEVFVRCKVMKDDGDELSSTEMFIQFEVIDTGRGFTDKEAQYLFKRFSQIDGSSTRQHGGTGLGLVISRQLAQLHGGDMAAKGVPGKGATFTFYIKTTLPSVDDRPPVPPGTPVAEHNALSICTRSTRNPSATEGQSCIAKDEPRRFSDTVSAVVFAQLWCQVSGILGQFRSINPHSGNERAVRTFFRIVIRRETTDGCIGRTKPINSERGDSWDFISSEDDIARRYSVTSDVLDSGCLSVEVQSRSDGAAHGYDVAEEHPSSDHCAGKSIRVPKDDRGENPVIFSHVVLVLQEVVDIIAFMDQILNSPPHSQTQLVLITDLAQRRKIMEQAPKYDYDQLGKDRRIRFIFKPLKPSKFAVIFDPQKEREMSTDRNQDSAQQVAVSQKQVYEEMTRRLGNKDNRVLLVEDNRVNQMVLLKFLSKVAIQVEVVVDGVQCTEKIYSKPHGYYSIILCDLHMPNKDGYQTCREIRKWEKKNNYPYLPIIALSANVLGDVYSKCVEAGFNSYVTKPVDFKELSTVMLTFLDPAEPGKPIEFMRRKKT